ncbi:stromal interaction molecule homolog [Panonychus citri]|uniref:stromal interaction molecule homolog n=1 Tax=Panonychus citri TaxID=50023 RepID=UPI002307FED1|nr:stromal interaction molecule homolog [Panonychus citri]
MNNHLVIFIISVLTLFLESQCDNLTRSQSANSTENLDWRCEELDFCDDKTGFEAIKWLHHQLDDDANGNVDITESDEFLRDELHYENANDRHRNFHGNDKHISVDELWRSWRVSEVHNWTVDETLDWLSTSLELPQYVDIFLNHKVDGTTLPRLANHQFISAIGIKDPIHRQKISLKAMDVVLFGPPKMHNYVKDIILVISCIIAIGGLWHGVITNRYSRKHLQKMLKDMDSLQKAEEQLQELQKELDNAKEEQRIATMEKAHLQEILASEMDNRNLQLLREGSISNIDDINRVQELAEELKIAKEQLTRAETALMNKSWAPPHKLQLWLQYTHELELRHYNSKRQAAESQLKAAREGCEKLKRKRSSFLGSFKVAHGSSIDDVDNRIHVAKAALSEVTRDLRERLFRWQQIEDLCGFPIVENRGILHIQTELYSCYPSPSTASLGSPSTTTSEAPSLTRNNSDNTIQELDNDTFDLTKNSQLNRSVTLRGKSQSSDVASLVSLSSQVAASSTTQLVQRNQIQNGSVHIYNGGNDENHSSSSSNNGEDEESKQINHIRPTFVLGDCPTIPENSLYNNSSKGGGRIGNFSERRRKESVFSNSNQELSNQPSTINLNGQNNNSAYLKHRTFTRIASLDEFVNLGDIDSVRGLTESPPSSSPQPPNTTINNNNQASTLGELTSSSNNLEEKGYSSGSETPPIKKKSSGSSKGMKFFSKLRKRKSLPEKEFTNLVQANLHID